MNVKPIYTEQEPRGQQTSYMVTGLPPGCPIFVLSAKDVFAMSFLRLYQIFTEDYFSAEKGQSLESLIDYFRAWIQGQGQMHLHVPD